MKWRMILRGRPDASIAVRLLVHIVRFAVLMIGLSVIIEVVLATYNCLDHIEYVKNLRNVVECASVTFFLLIWIGTPCLAIRFIPVASLAVVGSLLWAWLDRRQSNGRRGPSA